MEKSRKETKKKAGKFVYLSSVLCLFSLLIMMFLGGCGFSPLYSSQYVNARSAQVEVAPIDGTLGQSLRSRLEHRFNPSGITVAHEYRLVITLKEDEISSQAIRRDDIATRFTVQLKADYSLMKGDIVMLKDKAVFRSAYNVLDDPYASYVSKEDVMDRLKDLIADDIATRVALYLKDN